jgi:hypothetical protein
MTFSLPEATEILAATPATLRALLSSLSDPWLRAGDGTWSAADVLAHLVAGEETDWIPRMQIILEHGTSRGFTPFDRDDRPNPASIEALLDTFATLRTRNLATLRAAALDDERLDLQGLHPEFGAVRLRDMLATWAVHDLTHVAQIAETMAKRWRAEVGPWRRYLPVLDRPELPSD